MGLQQDYKRSSGDGVEHDLSTNPSTRRIIPNTCDKKKGIPTFHTRLFNQRSYDTEFFYYTEIPNEWVTVKNRKQ